MSEVSEPRACHEAVGDRPKGGAKAGTLNKED